MNAPYGQPNTCPFKRLAPRQDVLIDTIDQCSVEIEQEGRTTLSRVPLVIDSSLTRVYVICFGLGHDRYPLSGYGLTHFALYIVTYYPALRNLRSEHWLSRIR